MSKPKLITAVGPMNAAAFGALANGDLANFAVADTPGGIEAQEARGQKSFVASATLPIEFNSGKKEELEFFGVFFGTPVDDLFCEAQLPEGWKVEPTDHSMWNKLLDDKGRERASIFYKAAFYDRKAFINVTRRFVVSDYQPCEADGEFMSWDEPYTHFATVVLDCGEVVKTLGITPKEPGGERREIREQQSKAAYAWLKATYPDYESGAAYWD